MTIQQLLSNSSIQSNALQSFEINGRTYRSINACNITYHINKHHTNTPRGSLIDGGANGGLGGDDALIIEESLHRVNVTGFDTHSVNDIPLCTVAGLLQTTKGIIIAIFHNYAYLGKCHTVH
jgi:hypothetical protein